MPGWRDENSHNSRRRVPKKRLKRDASQVGAKFFVPILYLVHDFGAFGDFSDFLESISCKTSKSCQVRGSNPCRGATNFNTEKLNGLTLPYLIDLSVRIHGGVSIAEFSLTAG
jgi:hypothetical protein